MNIVIMIVFVVVVFVIGFGVGYFICKFFVEVKIFSVE